MSITLCYLTKCEPCDNVMKMSSFREKLPTNKLNLSSKKLFKQIGGFNDPLNFRYKYFLYLLIFVVLFLCKSQLLHKM